MPGTSNGFPNKGDRVEQLHTGIRRVGRVWYVDDLQVLVKWEDGRSSSLRIGRDRFHPAATAASLSSGGDAWGATRG